MAKSPVDPILPDPVSFREFGDTTGMRKAIFDGVVRELSQRFPITNDRYTLQLDDVKYRAPKEFDFAEQKKAIMRGRTLGWNLTGKWSLVDNATGKVVDKSKQQLIMQVPYLTDRGTVIFNGNEYAINNQMRLRPGIYSRVKDNGMIEAHFNVKNGTGPSFRIHMEPDTSVFRVNVGQANLKLYPILRAIGVQDRDLAEAWGRDILHANVAAADPRAVQRAYSKLVRSRQGPEQEKSAQEKHPKHAVNYTTQGTLQQCYQCPNFIDPNACHKVQGFIAPTGWCILWGQTFGKWAFTSTPHDEPNPLFEKWSQIEEEEGNRRRVKFIGELVCDDSEAGKEWAYLKVHKGLPEAAYQALVDQGVECEPRFDNPHISVLRNWEAQQLIAKYGKKWKTICGQGRKFPFSLQNAMVDLDPEGWKEMDRVWFLEAKSPELRAHRTSLGFEELPRGDDTGKEFQFHITVAVKPAKKPRGSTKLSFVEPQIEKAASAQLHQMIWQAHALAKRGIASFEIGGEEISNDAISKLAAGIDPTMSVVDLTEHPMEMMNTQEQASNAIRNMPPTAPTMADQDYDAEARSESESARADTKKKTMRDALDPKRKLLTQQALRTLLYRKKLAPQDDVKAACMAFGLTKEAESVDNDALRAVFERMEVDENTTEQTLGQRIKTLSPATIVDVTKKLVAINKGEADTDDRDSLAYQHFFGPEDLFAERVRRDDGGLARKMLWRATFKGNVQSISPGALSPQMRSVLLKSGLASPLEEVNPLEIYDQLVRVSRMGEGGIPSDDAVPDEARSVQPSHLGYIDPIRAPESAKIGVDSRLTHRSFKGSDGNVYTMMRTPSGRQKPVSAREMTKSVVAFPGEMESDRERVRAMVRGKQIEYVDRKEVDYELPHPSQMFTITSNLVPLISSIKGGRLLMGAKMATQALPLMGAEAPLVQNAFDMGADKSFEEIYGTRLGAVRAASEGVVTDVSNSAITVKHADGEKRYPLYNNFPFNRKSVVGSTIVYIRRADGALWVGPIGEYANVRQDGDCTLSINPKTKLSDWLPVTGFVEHENDKRLLRITLKSGRAFTITEDHSLMIMGDKGELVPCYPDSCVVGETRLPVAAFGAYKESVLTPDEALLFGLYLAEGHIPDAQPNLINIAVAPDERAEQVLALLKRLGTRPYRNGGNVCVNDQRLAALLKQHGGHLSHSKYISPAVLSSGDDVRKSVVAGYFAGDGCLSADTNSAIQLTAVSVSRRLRDDMSLLLASLDIFTTWFERANDQLSDKWRRAYGLRVVSEHIPRLQRWMFYEDRQQRLQQLADERELRASPYEIVPIPRAAHKLLYNSMEHVPHFVYKTVCYGYVAKRRIVGASGVFGDWARSDVVWDRIVNIETAPFEAKVYDFSVAESEAFAVDGGVVVHNTYLHNSPTVKPGDHVSKNGLLAKSNYTDDAGNAALGKNLRVAYMAYKGYNADDAIVISESTAKSLSSEHMYTSKVTPADNQEVSKKAFISLFPGKYDKQKLSRIDDNGVVKPGTVLQHGDPIALMVDRRKPQGRGVIRGRKMLYKDASETWDHEAPGVVTDVDRMKGGYKVLVKSFSPMQVGDKLSNRYGGKGVVSTIIPDEQMPRTPDGQPVDIMLNPLGVVSRTNPAQLIETALGKAAKKTGRPYKLPGFMDESYIDLAKRELARTGLTDTEDLTDPETGRKIPGVFTGVTYMMKLHHMAEGKSAGRDVGAYTTEGIPAGGGDEGSKRLGFGELSALVSHGATNLIRDAKVVRGQRNDEYWRALRLGYTPPSPKVPQVYEKFLSMLQASGINLKKKGDVLQLYALTDDDVAKLSGGPITKAETVTGDKLDPVDGGLFDVGKTGGHGGNRWSHIRLVEPMPNPVMEEPIRSILGLTKHEFNDVLAGRKPLGDGTGSKAILTALQTMNVDQQIDAAKATIEEGPASKRDSAVKRLGFLEGLKKMGIAPSKMMLTNVPVLPPVFRPITAFNNTEISADANMLYLDLMDANEDYSGIKKELGADHAGEERLRLYNSFKAVTGLGDPVGAKSIEKKTKGLLAQIFGGSPKFGMYQRRVLGAAVDTVGRGVITPNPSLNMDQVGMPEAKAWTIYRPFVMRALVRRGMSAMGAKEQIEKQSDVARLALIDQMSKRPVIITRAPVLHRYGVLAAWPVLTKGNTLQIPPIITPGFNADFDGDAMNYHVPVSDDAVQEAINKLMPSRNLYAVKDFDVHYTPRQEFLHGLYLASRAKKRGSPKLFRNKEAALAAFKRGEIGMDDQVEIR